MSNDKRQQGIFFLFINKTLDENSRRLLHGKVFRQKMHFLPKNFCPEEDV